MKIKKIIDTKNQLTVDLFHGTSTLFLNSIIQYGLGGINPISKWKVLELSKEVYNLSEQHLKETNLFKLSSIPFKKMVEQSSSGTFNFQHGETYLSPSKTTAARYAINKEYGSELLTYTIDFLKELLNNDIQYVKNDLCISYSKIFGLINARPSPIIIQAKNVKATSLLNEHGNDPKPNFDEMKNEIMTGGNENFDLTMQQTNFRLIAPIETCNLKFWLINVKKYCNLSPQYNLYEIKTNSVQH